MKSKLVQPMKELVFSIFGVVGLSLKIVKLDLKLLSMGLMSSISVATILQLAMCS